MTCRSCGKAVRKGTGRRAYVAEGGELVRAVVCAGCYGAALCVVVPMVREPCACARCRRGVAIACEGCVSALEANVRELTAANVALAGGAQ